MRPGIAAVADFLRQGGVHQAFLLLSCNVFYFLINN
jgi:hypothetical protein